jgi:tellurite resistance protein TehA-like permease
MATAIVSIASRVAGLDRLSVVFLWLSVAAFAPLALVDVGRARHPLALLHLAGDPRYGIAAFGFVADACVLGARVVAPGGVRRVLAVGLLVCGAAVWVAIVLAVGQSRGAGSAGRPRGEWLLAVVATEGLAILGGELARTGAGQPLHALAVTAWAVGGVVYLVLLGAIAGRLRAAPLRPGELTPDWWIVPGAAAIVAVGAVTVGGPDALALAGWGLATLMIPVLVAGELWQARRAGRPRFTPERWTMVFPLGMYSLAGQLVGHAAGVGWIAAIGRWWLIVAIGVWSLVAAGEVHHAFMAPR